MKKALIIGFAAFALAITSAPIAEAEQTQPAPQSGGSPGLVIAEDRSASLIATPTAPGEVTVVTAPGITVSVVGMGMKPRNRVTDAQGRAVFRGLTQGATYRVLTPRAATRLIIPSSVKTASALRVATTGVTDEVELSWKHTRTQAMGPVRYRIEAIPGTRTRSTTTTVITDTVKTNTATVRGLDLDTLYTFRVTPFNRLGDGASTSARMNRTLGQVHAVTARTTSTSSAPDASGVTPAVPAPVRPAPSVTATNPAPAASDEPAAPSRPGAPATRTVYVCPDGFRDAGSTCTKTAQYTYTTRAYTYRDDVQSSPYTYRTVTTGPAPIISEQSTSDVCPGGWNLEDYGVMGKVCRLYGPAPTAQVKNSPPEGWTDNGTAYTRTVRLKDATPTGFTDTGTEWTMKNPAPTGWSDDGSQYVTTTVKVATQVAT